MICLPLRTQGKITYIDLPFSKVIETGIRVWELEALYLIPFFRSVNSRVIYNEHIYELKTDTSYYLQYLWCSGTQEWLQDNVAG